MFLTLLVEAVLGGTAEALASTGVEKAPHLAQRIQHTLDLVEGQDPTAMEAAIRQAVAAARTDLIERYKDDLYTDEPDEMAGEMLALLDHAPFAEEVAAKLLYRGQPDFERLRRAYLDLPDDATSERWAALELPLLDFFDAVERHLMADPTVGPLLRHVQQLATLTRLAESSQIVADASQQIQAYQQRIADAGEETAGGVQQLVRLSGQQIDSLGQIAQLLRDAGRVDTQINTAGGAVFQESARIGGDLVNRDKITHIYHVYQQAPGRARLSEADFQRILLEYLGWVQKAYARARLYGLESVRTAQGRPVRSLAEVFVPVSLRIFAPPERRQIEEMARGFEGDPLAEHRAYVALVDERKQRGQSVELVDLLAVDQRLAVIGGAGSGKSTLLSYLALCLAEHAQRGTALPFRLPENGTPPIPLLIPLRYYRQYQEECRNAKGRTLDHPRSGTLAGFLPWYLKRRSPALELSEDFFDRLLLGGGCLIMLDGLDEIVDRTERGQMRAQVESLANDIYPDNQFVVTAREAGYRENAVFGDDFVRLDVQPLEAGEIRALVHNWCEQIYPDQAASQTGAIVDAIEEINQRYRDQNLPPLIETPLLTTMVISVKWGETELPRERAKLYEAAVKVILQGQYLAEDESREALVNWGGPWEEQQTWLSQLALAMHSRGRDGAAVGENAVRAMLADVLAPEQLDAFVAAVRLRGGLLEERGELFQFLHLTFQEYLAARLLAKQRARAWPILRKHLSDTWWREVFLLHYGFAKTDYAPYAQEFLDWLSAIPDGDGAARLAGLELAAAAVLEIERPEPALRRRQAERLAAALTDPDHPGSPEQRAAAGRTLGRLGDPRPGVGVRPDGLPDIDWVRVPETNKEGVAEFIYGEAGERRREPTFWMARYPVTYRQFQAFVEAPDGLRNPEWWQGLDASERERQQPYAQRFEFWNHPRENVTWYQAVAFCRWLTAKAKEAPSLLPDVPKGTHRIALPTEWQWEKAARGHDGRIYPWGNDYVSGYANVDESEDDAGPHNLQRTSAVGLYPQGASPYGILELSGNVWEWCLNEYRNPERVQEEGGATRVLRGGSWLWGAESASASARLRIVPFVRYWYNYGFRCVVVPLSR